MLKYIYLQLISDGEFAHTAISNHMKDQSECMTVAGFLYFNDIYLLFIHP